MMEKDENTVKTDKDELYPELKLKPKYLIEDYLELVKTKKNSLPSKKTEYSR